jgi:hypothetical protein
MGSLWFFGIIPLEGSIFPLGIQNAIPDFLRPYIPYFPKTTVPIWYIGYNWGNYPIYPLGMKALPNRYFTSLNKQIYRAIIDSDFTKISEILDEKNFEITKEIVLPEYGMTAMGMACALNSIEMVHYLIKRGVDVDYPIGPYHKTALHIAIENGHDLLAKLLLNNGANIEVTDGLGLDVYDKAEFRGFYDYKKFLDYFKENLHNKNSVPYDDYKYTRELILEDPMTINFTPSKLVEYSCNNKLNYSSEKEKFSLDKFEFFMFNQFDLKNLENMEELKLRKRYDDLYHFYNFKI